MMLAPTVSVDQDPRFGIEIDEEFIDFREESVKRRVWSEIIEKGATECRFCKKEIASGKSDDSDTKDGNMHHLIKKRRFPAPYKVNNGHYTKQESLSAHHPSNLAPCCESPCHSYWETWANGRPHLKTWALSNTNVLGQEIQLILLNGDPDNIWQQARWQKVVNDSYGRNNSCVLCGAKCSGEVSLNLPYGPEEYESEDVICEDEYLKPVHIVPPYDAPWLVHDQRNIVLMCLHCLFIEDWRGKDPIEWLERFGKRLLKSDRVLVHRILEGKIDLGEMLDKF